jgi:hypothetical protein
VGLAPWLSGADFAAGRDGVHSCCVVEGEEPNVLSGIIGTGGGGVVSFPPTGRNTGSTGVSFAM